MVCGKLHYFLEKFKVKKKKKREMGEVLSRKINPERAVFMQLKSKQTYIKTQKKRNVIYIIQIFILNRFNQKFFVRLFTVLNVQF